MSKQVRIVANWKMNKTTHEAVDFITKLSNFTEVVYIAPPFTSLYPCFEKKHQMLSLGAQNIHHDDHGAYTGEISAKMVKDVGAEFVIVGHSERRSLFSESDQLVNKKIKQALNENLEVILCIGETHTQRNENQTAEVLKKQLYGSLHELSKEHLSQITIAYEPIWAIGTGQPATAQMAQETHFMLRCFIKEKWGDECAEKIYILHGGSIKPENVQELISQRDIDGVLVGGASLDVTSFTQIIQNSGNFKS